MALLKHSRHTFNSSMSQRNKINDTFPLIGEMRLFFFSPHIYANPHHYHHYNSCMLNWVNSDQFNSECEKVSLSDNHNHKKFKIININQATNMSSERMDDGNVGEGNKFGHKTQLIEIDKLIINNGPPTQQQKKSSKNGVWHQVSLLSIPSPIFFYPPQKNYFSTSATTSSLLLHGERKTFFSCFFSVSHLMNVAVPLREEKKFSAHTKVLFCRIFFPLPVPFMLHHQQKH